MLPTRKMVQLPFYNTFFKSTTVPAIELAEILGGLAPGFSKCFFTNSGSEGNDTIIRMVRHYWKLRGKPTKSTFIRPPQRLSRFHRRWRKPWRHGLHAQAG